MTKRDFQAQEYAAEQEANEQVRFVDWEAETKKNQREFMFVEFAQAALTGLCISRHLDTKEELARQAFDCAEAMTAEFDKRRAKLHE